MPTLYVAHSRNLGKWGEEVGVSKHLYKIGLAPEAAEAAIDALNAGAHAGEADWKLVKKQPVEAAVEEAVIARLAAKERMLDPAYYPRLRGARGIFKVKPVNVENHFLVKRALAGEPDKPGKLKPADIAAYLIENGLG